VLQSRKDQRAWQRQRRYLARSIISLLPRSKQTLQSHGLIGPLHQNLHIRHNLVVQIPQVRKN
jgi:hypothetical protein